MTKNKLNDSQSSVSSYDNNKSINFGITCWCIIPEFTDIVELIIRMALYIAILHLKHNTYTNYVIQNNFMIEW